jgi:hypothetical protein
MDSEDISRDAARAVASLILEPIIDQMVKMAVEYVVNEAKKQDKGRNPPFWANNWRSTR